STPWRGGRSPSSRARTPEPGFRADAGGGDQDRSGGSRRPRAAVGSEDGRALSSARSAFARATAPTDAEDDRQREERPRVRPELSRATGHDDTAPAAPRPRLDLALRAGRARRTPARNPLRLFLRGHARDDLDRAFALDADLVPILGDALEPDAWPARERVGDAVERPLVPEAVPEGHHRHEHGALRLADRDRSTAV